MPLRGFVTASVPIALTALIALSTAPACSNTAGVSEVYTSLDGDGSRRRDTFFTDTSEIHCIAKAQFGRPDVTFNAVFHRIRVYDPGKDAIIDDDTYTSANDLHPNRSEGNKTPQVFDFALQRVDANGDPSDKVAYAVGSYICEVEIDGQIVKTAAFNVNFPECPLSFLKTGSTCLGFFKAKEQCPKGGLKSDNPTQCECDEKTGAWNCPND